MLCMAQSLRDSVKIPSFFIPPKEMPHHPYATFVLAPVDAYVYRGEPLPHSLACSDM